MPAKSIALLCLAACLATPAAFAAPDGEPVRGDILTQGYDAARTGMQSAETILHPGNVAPATFGKLASLPVDGAVHVQPLVVTRLALRDGSVVDIVVVATGNNSLFAFNVGANHHELLWQRHLGPDSGADARAIGIFGAPVIDRSSATLFVVAGILADRKAGYALHALDLRDGLERRDSPVAIEGSVAVDDAQIAFQPTDRRIAVQRAALALANGKVIVAFGGDFFEGWVFSYDGADLQRPPGVFCTTCVSRVQALSRADYLSAECTFLGPGGGIWQSGRGPVVDARGSVYFFTGNKAHIVKQGCLIPQGSNACADCTTPGGCPCKGVGQEKVCRGPDTCIANVSRDRRAIDLNEALVRLDPARDLVVAGWYRPQNWNAKGLHGLEFNDLDFGGSGPLLVPGTSRLVGGGKDGVLYLFDVHSATQDPMPLQSFAIAAVPSPPLQYYRHILGGPVLWPRPHGADGSRLFVWRMNDTLRSYRLTDHFTDCDREDVQPGASDNCRSVAASRERIDHHPGGILSISADGDRPDSAIVWAYTGSGGNGPGLLMAFRALPDPATPDRLQQIWNSDACAGDAIEVGATFAPPSVSNGRVYVATGSNRVDVFGLIPPRPCALAEQPEVSEHLNNF